jgi:hypothetical protein
MLGFLLDQAPEGVEGEDGFVHPEDFDVLVSSGLDGPVHIREEIAVVGVRVIDDLLPAADEFEFDAVLLVSLLD